MQVPPLSDVDLKELLTRPLVGKIATVSSKGEIRMSPIWFGTDGDDIIFNTWENTGLVKNLKRNPKCSVMIDTPDFPYIGVHFWGTAAPEGPENDEAGIAKLFAPYRGGEDVAREYAQLLISWGKRVYVRFKPERKTTWDFRGG
jgi:PPOX class probable F420-dependent enzyme